MWNIQSERLAHGLVIRMIITVNSLPILYADVLHRWLQDADFRAFFNDLLVDAPFSAFRWETPPITTATANRPFEFVLIDSPGLATHPNINAFAEHFRDSSSGVVEFPNLGRDATLIAPCPSGPLSAYSHLGSFVRQAAASQKHALWQAVSAAMQRRLGPQPVWLSTAGGGVSWLHVRLDDQPKYYGYAPYRETC